MLTAILCAAMAIAALFPETEIGKALRRVMVEAPARMLNRIRRGHVALAVLALAILTLAYVLGRQSGIALFSQVAAEGLPFLATADLIGALDLVTLALLVSALVRSRAVARIVAAEVRR